MWALRCQAPIPAHAANSDSLPSPSVLRICPPPPRSGDCRGLVPLGPVVVWSHSPKHSDLCVEVPSLPPWTPSWELLSAQIQARTPAFCFSTPKLCVGDPPPLLVGIHPLHTCGRISLHTRIPGKPLLGCGDEAALLPGSPHLPSLAAMPAGPTALMLHGGLTVPFLPLLWPFHQ